MKKLDVSSISLTNAMPVKQGAWQHLQSAYYETLQALARAIISDAEYDPTKGYILFGCNNSSTSPNFNISAGAIFYNGEIYIVPAANFTVSGSNVAVGKITLSYFSGVGADPVEFTDGVPRNIHQIFQIEFAPGLEDSGDVNFDGLRIINSNIPQLNLTGSEGASVSGSYPNLNLNSRLQWKHFGTYLIGDLNTNPPTPYLTLLSGSNNNISGYRYNFPNPEPDANYIPFVNIGNSDFNTVEGLQRNTQLSFAYGARDINGFYFSLSTPVTGAVQNINVDIFGIRP